MRNNNSATVTALNIKWSQPKLLAEARRRTKELFNPSQVQSMLGDLLKEAGWTEEAFIDALCQDVVRKGTQ